MVLLSSCGFCGGVVDIGGTPGNVASSLRLTVGVWCIKNGSSVGVDGSSLVGTVVKSCGTIFCILGLSTRVSRELVLGCSPASTGFLLDDSSVVRPDLKAIVESMGGA